MNKVFTIAEVGQAHEGSLGILHSYIDAVAETSVDAIKFQTHIADAESSQFEEFRVNFSYVDKTRMDYWRRMSFTKNQWRGIKQHCDDVGLEFISSPFSLSAVELLEELDVKKYKFGSGEISNMLMLETVCKTGKEIILSSGMSCFNELDRAVNFVKSYGNKLTLLQCTTRYPTLPEDVGLNVISEMKQRYDVDVGLSDHSGTIFPSLAAVSLGATMLEAHVVFDKRMFGPDSSSSLTVDEFKTLMSGVRDISAMLSNPINKNDISGKLELKAMFGKSLAVRSYLPEGHIITREDLETKKPAGFGVPAADFESVIGKKLNKSLVQWAFLTEDDFI